MLLTLTAIFLLISLVGRKISKAFADVASLPTAPAQAPAPQAAEELSDEAPYFSYEQEMVDTAFQATAAPSAKPAPAPAPVVAAPAPANPNTVDFDLCQAVIYQTILHNPYWTESRQ